MNQDATAPRSPVPRSPLLMSRHDTVLLVVDIQEKLLPQIPHYQNLVWNVRRLLEAAELLGVPRLATEQYPKGLGPTVAELRRRLGDVPAKTTFSCSGCGEVVEKLRELGRPKVLVVGIETHVCVLQTLCDLLTEGYQPFVAIDAVASRAELEHNTALRRMDSAGVTLTTTETSLFEWCERAGTDEFKQISNLVREKLPPGLR